MRITFLGAAREVTGSCYWLCTPERSFLVDCGLFQGGSDADLRNRARFLFDPAHIDFVLLTHAHIDHSGLLPRLVELGFRGPIYSTEATCDLLGVMLPDAAYVQEREAERNHGRHSSAPLYTVAQAEASLRLLHPLDYDRMVDLGGHTRCRFRDAGHILGSSIVELWSGEGGRERKTVFSGDLGQPGRPIVRDATPIEEADSLLVESTYGNRLHKSLAATEEELAGLVNDTLGRGRGNIVIPAFAVGRTQELLHVLADLVRRGRVATRFHVYVDSPLAAKATEVTLRHQHLVDSETRELLAWGRKNGSAALDVQFTESAEESKRLNAIRHGAVIISASGMCDAGRIKYHLLNNLPRPDSVIVFTGFQAAGTLGRRLVDGARSVRIFGEEVPVRARIATIGGLSAHADQAGLLAWLRGFRKAPAETYVVHGEAGAAQAFADCVQRELGWSVRVPRAGESAEL
ncbi:MAG: MBL fold metallo-hydrolase RNA specificity domain-containing protein [Burkholderiales bacterium]